MAKGANAKQQITEKILKTFPNAFQYEKEIRIPMEENGEEIQIKCVLTCAKTNVNVNNQIEDAEVPFDEESDGIKGAMTEPSAQEKQAVADLISKLGI
ncbi:MAG: hypothetical protein LUC37_03870 [Prevotella sp.]|nr:hypothetical protein [Prevotella sp.]